MLDAAGAEVESCFGFAAGEEIGVERPFEGELIGDETNFGLEFGEASGDKGLMFFAEENRRMGLGLVFGDLTVSSGGIRCNGTSTTIRSSLLESPRCIP